LYSRDIGATYRYTLHIDEPGAYDVSLWWTEFFNRSTNVAIDITHRDGTARVYINQKQNGGQWNKVGSWYFTADAIVTVHSDATDKSTNADAVRLISADSGRNGNSAPTIGGVPATAVTVDTAYSFIASANDVDGDDLTFNISNPPGWVSFNSNTGVLTGTPAMGGEGTTQNIVISVSDGLRTTSLPAFDITVYDAIVSGLLADPTPGERNFFGGGIVTLANGNVIISDNTDFNIIDEGFGSLHLYNPLSKTLIKVDPIVKTVIQKYKI